MKKAILLLSLLSLVFSCGEKQDQNKRDSAASCSNDVNPNGSSELAILMRNMATWTDSCKSAVNSSSPNPEEPVDLRRIHLLKKTDETIDKKLFDACADVYLQKVDSFKNIGITLDTRRQVYNSMVNACISCHENFCGGPIKRIQKLFISEI